MRFRGRDYRVVFKNLSCEFLLSLHEFIFSNDVVADKLLDLNIAVVVGVALAKEFVDDLAAVIFVDALLRKEHHHFVFVNVAVAVDVDHSEFVV